MKFILILGTFFSLGAVAATPAYTLSSPEVQGEYRQTPKGCRTTDYKPCADAVVKKLDGKLVLVIDNYNYEDGEARAQYLPLTPVKGRLIFKWDNPSHDDCDDPGCGNLLGLSGVIYPKKVGNKYVPAIKLYVKWEFPFPDEEDAPEGEVTETESYVKL